MLIQAVFLHYSPGKFLKPIFTVWNRLRRFFFGNNDSFSREPASEETLLSSWLHSTTEGIWGLDVAGNITFVNEAAVRLFGFKNSGEMIGRSSHDIVQWLTLDGQPNPKENCRLNQAFQRAEYLYLREELLCRSDGSRFYGECRLTPTRKNGITIGALLTFRDITQERNVRVALEEERERFRHLVNESPVPTATLMGPEFVYTLMNRAYEEQIGRSDARGKKLEEVFPELEGQGIYEMLGTVLKGKTVQLEDYPLALDLDHDGVNEQHYFDITYAPLRGVDGGIEGILVVAPETTQRVNAEIIATNQSAWLESVLEELPLSFFLVEPETGKVKFANRRAREFTGVKMVGYSTATREDQPFKFFDQHGNPVSPLEAPSARIMRGEHLNGTETSLQTPRGKFHFQNFSHILPERFGQSSTALLAMLDVSREKEVQARLKNSEAQLALALATSKVGFYDWDVPSNRVTFSQQMKDDWQLDTTAEGKELSAVMERIHPEDRNRVLAEIEASLYRHAPFKTEYRLLMPGGNVVWLSLRGQVTHDSAGKALRFFGTSLDISERKIREELLSKSAENFRFLANSMPQIVWSARADGVLNYTNDRWTEYSGSSDPEKWISFVHPEDLPQVLTTWSHAVRTLEAYEAEFRLRNSAGMYRWHLVRALANAKGGDEGTLWYGTCTDVSVQKELEWEIEKAKAIAEAANDAKTAFLANMSHEIRTPLGAILGFTDLLQDRRISPEERYRYVDIIQRNGRSLTRIIDDILDLSKVEAGRMEIVASEFNVRKLTEDVMNMLAERAIEKNIYLRQQIDLAIPANLTADSGRIRQVLLNLIGNAVKFTSTGGVTVHASMRELAAGGHLLAYTVSDTGTGLTQFQMNRLFQPFNQADESVARKFGGTGLGLVLARRFARAMGGDVTIDRSEAGKGSTFRAEFVVGLAEPTVTLAAAADAMDEPGQLLRGARILLVDDNQDNLFLIRNILIRYGAEVTTADSGARGVELGLAGKFDLALMDLQMPLLDGYSALRSLRAGGFLAPVIAITAHAMDAERKLTAEAGFAAHLTKPVNAREIVLKSAECIGRKDSSSRKVLLVEDDQDIRELVSEVLRGDGIEVDAAASGKEALEFLEKGPLPALVLLDITLPDMNGGDFLAEVRRNPAWSKLIVYITSGWDNLAERAAQMGANGSIRKPYDLDLLQAEVMRQLGPS